MDTPNEDSKRTSITMSLNPESTFAKGLTKISQDLSQQVLAQIGDKDSMGRKRTVLNQVVTLLTPGKDKDGGGGTWPPTIKTTVQIKRKDMIPGSLTEYYDCKITDTDGNHIEINDSLIRASVKYFIFSVKVYFTKQGNWGFCRYLRRLVVYPMGESIDTFIEDC